MNLTYNDVMILQSKFGNITLSELAEALKQNKNYKCPKCEGKGYVTIEYNAYPAGLPDSGFVNDIKTKNVKCDICEGIGYTEDKIIVKTKSITLGYIKSGRKIDE